MCTRVYRAYDRSRVCACIRNDLVRVEKFSFSASRVTLPRRIAEMPLLRLPGYTEAAGLFNKRRRYPRSYARYINERSSADSTESRWFLVSERRLRGLSRGRQQSRCVLPSVATPLDLRPRRYTYLSLSFSFPFVLTRYYMQCGMYIQYDCPQIIWGPFTKPLRNRRGSAFIIAPHVSPFSARNGVLIITRCINPREPVGTHLRVSFRVGVCESASKIVSHRKISLRACIIFIRGPRIDPRLLIAESRRKIWEMVSSWEKQYLYDRSMRLLSDVIENRQHFARKLSIILHREVSGRSRDRYKALFFARLM